MLSSGAGRMALVFAAGMVTALMGREIAPAAVAQPANDGMYLRMRNAEARLNAIENQQAIARLRAAPSGATQEHHWMLGVVGGADDIQVEISALQQEVAAQQKQLDELSRGCAGR